ncbi:MAG TPA: PQQ-dependent sugar dehydrogenase, partial [Burkholderiales bacterium]|nr:PQQ-dependent sugar dehydrogenase [Burkholderiales bacterium]
MRTKNMLLCRARFLLVFSALLAGCGGGGEGGGTTGQPDASITLRLEQVNASLSFPLFLTAPPGDTLRLFVVEKGGRIKILDRATGALIATFLDISSLVSTGSEQGLLGLAFDPLYASNRRFYVSYTDTGGNSVIARYLVNSTNANLAVSAADRILLTVPQPFANHNGGMIAFGQSDNFLYVGLGDGGDANDPGNRAQDTGVLLGKLLRIDVSQGNLGDPPYTVPADNPFVGVAGADEIWSYGLRNPWRFSFDRQIGDLYIADVGQGAREEVNASTFASGAGKAVNYGWKIMEGTICRPPTTMCDMTGLTPPVVDYDHSGGACSITGGYVYRGSAVPALRGTYFYGDFCARFVRSFKLVNGMATEQTSWAALNPGGNITSFGEDEAGELYIMT